MRNAAKPVITQRAYSAFLRELNTPRKSTAAPLPAASGHTLGRMLVERFKLWQHPGAELRALYNKDNAEALSAFRNAVRLV